MSFNAYIENIEKLTGLKPEDFKQKALDEAILYPDLKATEFTHWLKERFQLGHGHSMALWKYFVDHQWIEAKNSKLKK